MTTVLPGDWANSSSHPRGPCPGPRPAPQADHPRTPSRVPVSGPRRLVRRRSSGASRSGPSPARALAAWAAVLALPALLALAAPAAAQTDLVSNATQTGTISSDFTAQSFRTGFAGGTVTEIQIKTGTFGASFDNMSVKIRKDNGSGLPDMTSTGLVADFDPPASFTQNSTATHTPKTAHTPVKLDPHTTYWVSMYEGSTGNRITHIATSSDSESSGGGWGIGDGRKRRGTESQSWGDRTTSVVLAIRGKFSPGRAFGVPIPDQSVRAFTAFRYQVPSNAFHDPDTTTLTYAATLADGTALPSWLTFTAATRTFSGVPNGGTGTVSVKVAASDGDSDTADGSDTFDITVLERLLYGGAPTLSSAGLVSNTGKTATDFSNARSHDHAQAFTTGNSANGYRLTAVTVHTRDGAVRSDANPKIFEADGQGRPTGTQVGSTATWTIPTAGGAGLKKLTVNGDGIELKKGTKYAFVLDPTTAVASGNSGYIRTASDDEDAGGETGWSIENSSWSRIATSASWTDSHTNPYLIQIHGYAVATEAFAAVAGGCTHPGAVVLGDGGGRETGGPDRPTGCVEPLGTDDLIARWEYADATTVRTQRVEFRPSEPAGQAWVGSFVGNSTRELEVSFVRVPPTPLDPGTEYDVRVRKRAGGSGTPWGEWAVANNVRVPRHTSPNLSNAAPTLDVARIPVRVVSRPTWDSNNDTLIDSYVRDDMILIDVEMTEAVTVDDKGDTGNVKLNLELDGGGTTVTRQAELQSVLYNGRTLRFAYTVATGDDDDDGVFVRKSTGNDVVILSGGATVKSADTGRDAVLTMTGDPIIEDARARVDGSEPSGIGPRPVSGARVTDRGVDNCPANFPFDWCRSTGRLRGAKLAVEFDKTLQPNVNKAQLLRNLEVRVTSVHGGNRNAHQYPTDVSISGFALTLTLGGVVHAGDRVTVSHFFAGNRRVLQGTNGREAPSFRDLVVQEGETAPAPLRADAAGTSLRVVFSEALDTGSTPSGSAFSVFATDNNLKTRTLAGTGTATITGSEVLVTLAEAVSPDEQAHVSYTKPGANPLRASASGNAAVQSFDRFLAATAHDTTPPTLLSSAANILQRRTDDPLSQGKSRIMLFYDERLENDVRKAPWPAAGDFALSSTDSGAVPGAAIAAVSIEDTAVVLITTHWLKDNIDYTVAYTPGTHRIRDLAGNAVAGFTETVRSFAVGQPVLRGSKVTGTRLELNMRHVLNPGAVPPPSAFGLWETDVQDGQTDLSRLANRVLSVMVNSSLAVLELAHPVYPCAGERPLRVSYTRPESGDQRFQTAAGYGAESWTAEKWRGGSDDYALATNEWHGRCAEWLAGTFMGSVVLKSERPFARDRGEPKPAWFAVKASGGPVTVTGAAFSADDPKELKLEVSREFAAGETVTVSYRRPAGASGLWDVDGNQLKDVVDAPVAAGPPALSVSDARAVEGGAVEFTVTLSAASDAAVTVDYATSDGTAAAGADYTATSGTLTFAAGETAKTVRVATAADAADEDAETFALMLTSPSGATLADASATGTIVDAAAALRASFHGLPEAHDGSRLFGFEIRFSEEFGGLRLTALKRALAVTGGRLVDAKRTVRGENRRVTVRVRPSRSGAVTLALAAPSDCSAADAVCASDGRMLSAAVSASVPGPDTPVAAVVPVLSVADARADEGGALEFQVTLDQAATGDVTVDYATADGTATAGADYTAATGTLTFAAGETAKTVSVVLLHDGLAENDETVTLTLSNPSGATVGDGEATGTVADVAPLTASFHGLPPEHDGRKLFQFEVRFSEEFRGLRLTAFKAGALQVAGGRVIDAKRAVRGQNRSVTVKLRPSSVDDMTITLPGTTDCSAASAICASDGRKLTGSVTATVQGPVAVSVADAEAQEGADAAIEFAVTLSRAASGEVTVDYATRDGTATAGEDYTFTRGTLTFAAGDTEKTVEVPILDDALDEGSETFTLKLTGARGAAIDDGEATGTIRNSDPLQKMWLSRFGRTVADHVTAAVSDRLSGPLTGAQVTVGGQTVNLAEAGDDAFIGRTLTSIAQVMGAPSGPANDPGSGPGQAPGSMSGAGPGSGSPGSGQTGAAPWPGTGLGLSDAPAATSGPGSLPAGRDLLLGSAFHLAKEGDGGRPGLAAWGRVTVGGFDGEAPADGGAVRIDGNVTTGILGTDAEWRRLLAGVAVSVSEGEGTFDQPGVDSGTVESTMTTVSPYARLSVNERVSVWGLAGYGTGDMTIVQAANDATGQPERVTRTDLSMRLAALGGRGALLQADEAGGFDLALKADGFFVETTSEAISNEGDTSADASRVRLALEGSRAFRVGDGGVFTPGLELGLRHDGGDAETGTGVELGGRLSYADPETGLSVEGSVRALVAHEDSNYREWGAAGAVRLAPGERGRGLSFSLAPTYGAPGSGVDRLWSARDARGLAPTGGEFEPESRLAGELGYGMALFGDRFTGTPNVGFGLTGAGARDYRIGWRLTSVMRGDPGFEVTLDATRREPANDNGATPVEHGVMFRSVVRW